MDLMTTTMMIGRGGIILAVLCCICISTAASTSESYRKELRTKNVVDQKVIKQVDSSTETAKVDPSRVIQLSWRPRVFLYDGFLSDEECDHLISLSHGNLEKPLVKDPGSWKIASNNQNTTPLTSLRAEQDDIVARIEDRISAWTFLPKVNSEPLHIMHFVSENTKDTLDYKGDTAGVESSEPLLATVILYLSNVTYGGETLFIKSESKNTQVKDGTWSECAKRGYAVKPIKGNALLFFSLRPNTGTDESSSNARCPVHQGEKWCASKIFHLRSLEAKKTLLDAESIDCSDEEGNCAQWAALGECEKNPIYMKGTPDYSGSCRKSCNAC